MEDTELKINQDVDLPGATIQYMTGPAEKMMENMVGRNRIKGEYAILPGIELAIQKLDQIRDHTPEHSPDKRSAQQIIRDGFGNSFDLILNIPNSKGSSRAMIWYLTKQEFDLAHKWELIEEGMQEDLKGLAVTEMDGEFRSVIVNGLQRPPFIVDHAVYRETFQAYVAPVDQMHKVAEESRENFLKQGK
ncbi:MAG: hypothetical protein WC797_02735 [Candidatus Paceibacterota bacterium]|jgi:hypothetical protein